MKWILIILSFFASLTAAQTPEDALKRLQMGNQRFVNEKLLHPDRTHERRLSLSEKQSPYGVIITCSDSRVVPEVVFDQGLGDLFVIRVAGNVIGSTELESILYAVDHLNPSILVVMGHERCGAVGAVLQGNTEDIPAIASYIEPSVTEAKSGDSSDLLALSIKLNAQRMGFSLLDSPTIKKQIEGQKIAIYAGYYNLQTGFVEFFPQILRASL
jgi:carbonic anhydrase